MTKHSMKHTTKSSKSTTQDDFKVKDKQPWYKNYMVIVFVIGMPLFVVVACIWFIFYSFEIKDSVVRDDWYMDGKTLYQDVSRDKLAHDLDLHGEMMFADDGEVTFYLHYPDSSIQSGQLSNGTPLSYPDTLDLSISHATHIDKDRDAVLKHTQDNQYKAEVHLDPLLSKYYIEVSNNGDLNWRMREVTQLPTDRITFTPLTSFDK